MKRKGRKHKKIQNDRVKPRSGQKMKGQAVETRVRKYGEKKKVGKIETRSDRERREGEKETGWGVFVSGRHFLSRDGLKGNNGGKNAVMAGWRSGEKEERGPNTGSHTKKRKQLKRLRKKSCCASVRGQRGQETEMRLHNSNCY